MQSADGRRRSVVAPDRRVCANCQARRVEHATRGKANQQAGSPLPWNTHPAGGSPTVRRVPRWALPPAPPPPPPRARETDGPATAHLPASVGEAGGVGAPRPQELARVAPPASRGGVAWVPPVLCHRQEARSAAPPARAGGLARLSAPAVVPYLPICS